jgi:predicted nucleic acid-binding protein
MNTFTETAPTPSGYLLDGNVLIALQDPGHVLSPKARAWLKSHKKDTLYLCSVTEGTLLRYLMNPRIGGKQTAAKAWQMLSALHAHPTIKFLDSGFSYLQVRSAGLTGHKEVTDAWLITLAMKIGHRLATLDAGLCNRHPDATELVSA